MITASDGSLTVTVPIRIKRSSSRKAVALPDGSAVQPPGRHADADPVQARPRSSPAGDGGQIRRERIWTVQPAPTGRAPGMG